MVKVKNLNTCLTSTLKDGGIKLSTAQRNFFTEIRTLVDKHVAVTTTTGKTYMGTIVGLNPETLSVCLGEVKDEKGNTAHRVFINGNVIVEISSAETPFDLRALSYRLEKVFPTMVKLYEDQGFIWVMEKVKLTEQGIAEGSGPVAERVKRVYDQFMVEQKKR